MKKIIKLTLVAILITLSSCSIPKVSEKNNQPADLAAQEVKEERTSSHPTTLLSNIRQITHAGKRSGEGYFNADGTKMIFQSERTKTNPFYQIYLMDLITGKTSRVSSGSGKTTCAWIHPSGKKALYSSTHLDRNIKKKMRNEFSHRHSGKQKKYSWSYDKHYDIFESSVDGKNIRRITKAIGYDAEGSYSPNGREIVFASNRSGYSRNLSLKDKAIFKKDNSYMMEIYKINVNGTGLKRLTHTRGYDGGPFFSYDGKMITWRRFSPDGRRAEIYTMKSDGSKQTRVTQLDAMSWAPFFHPSGDYIIFGTNIHGYANFELYIVDTKGLKQPIRVTNAKGFDGLPVFHPNGRQLSWTKRDRKGHSQIYISDWNDAKARKLLGLTDKGPKLNEYTADVNTGDLTRTVSFLASPAMKGRAAGSREERIYASRMGKLFKSMGLKGAAKKSRFFQPFKFISGVELGSLNSLAVLGEDAPEFKVREDWMPLTFSKTGSVKPASIIFTGYGIVAPATEKFKAYNSYKDIDVKGKWVLAFRYIPEDVSVGLRQHYTRYSSAQFKAMVARNNGAIGIIFINGPNSDASDELEKLKFDGGLAGISLPVITVSDDTAEKLLNYGDVDLGNIQDKLDTGEFVKGFDINKIKLAAHIELDKKYSKGINILAKINVPGATQSIIVGAHGDHLGLGHQGTSLKREGDVTDIHFGADDNASGVAAVMEIAHKISDLHKKKKIKLKYNIIFAIWSAEEIGILGSNHFVNSFKKKFKIKKLNKKIKAYINLDMVGRLKKKLIVQSIASSDKWPDLIEEAAINNNLEVTTQKDPYVPTDAMTFYMGGTPTLSLFTGAHGDYHSPRDTWQKLNYEGLKKITNFALDVTTKIATTKGSLGYKSVKGSRKHKGGSRKFRVFLGTIPDYSQEGVTGVRLSGAAKGGPASKAGVKSGDIIIKLAGKNIESLYDYVYVLQALKPNVEVQLIVLRKGAPVTLKIIPAKKE